MKLALRRAPFSDKGTTGTLYMNGEPFCFTLEPAKDDPAHPCIPAGAYKVLLEFSHRFNRPMPFLQGVPGRTAIEIHWGNYVVDTEGCIMVGDGVSDGLAGLFLANTRNTFDRLYQQLQDAQTFGIEIDVIDPPAAPEEFSAT